MKNIKGIMVICAIAGVVIGIFLGKMTAGDGEGATPGKTFTPQPPGVPPGGAGTKDRAEKHEGETDKLRTPVRPDIGVDEPEERAPVEEKMPAEPTGNERKVETVKPTDTSPGTPTTGATGNALNVTETSTSADDKPIDFNFRNTDIQIVVQKLAEQMDKNFIMPKTLVGNVTIIMYHPVPKIRAFELLQAILNSQGYSMYQDEFFIRIEKKGTPEDKSHPTGVEFIKGEKEDDGALLPNDVVTAIVVLQYINAQELTPVLNSVKSTSALVLAFPRINALFVRDSQQNLDYLLSIVQKLDQPGTSGKITIVKLQYSVANEMAATLIQVIAASEIVDMGGAGAPPTPSTSRRGGRGATGQSINIIPDKRTNNIIVIATEKETEALIDLINKLDVPPTQVDYSMHTFQCNNQKAKDLAALLEKFVNQRPTVSQQPKDAPPIPGITQTDIYFTADEVTNTILVQAPPQEWPFYRDLMKELDQPQRQALIEVWIVELTSTDESTVGVEIMPSDVPPNERTGPMQQEIYPVSRPSASSLSGIFGGALMTEEGTTSSGSSVGSGATIGIRTLTGTEISIDGRSVRIPNFDVFVRAVKDKSNLRVLQSPKLLTLNNKKATVTITEEISIRTSEVTNIEATGGVSTATFNRKDIGVTVDLEPQINADDFVIMEIKLEVSNVVGEVSSDPTISKRTTENTVRCENKQTIVISGLRRNIDSKSKTGIPLLGDIPILGRLFSTTTKSNINTNLLIFITPHIVTETTDMLAMTDYLKAQRLEHEEGRLRITGKSREKDGKKPSVVWDR